MEFLSFLGLKKAPSPKKTRGMLPARHTFVDVAVRNGGPKGSVCFEEAGIKTFITSVLPGMAPGQHATFSYLNDAGKFRFSTALKAVDAKQATFEIPGKIEAVQTFAGPAKRSHLRVDTTVTVQWRYAASGKIESDWHKGVLSDLSRTGSSLATDITIKSGNTLELKIPLVANGTPTLVRADAIRIDKIEGTSKFNIGLTFHQLRPDADKAVVQFINRRQVDLRQRGLA